MAKTIATFEVQVKGKNISVVAKDTKKLGTEVKKTGKEADVTSKKVDKLNKSANSVRRGLHGAAGMSSNATKNFSKMNQGMGGSTGLVAAYATLAANVFAVSAAFTALRSAAQVETLTQGFGFLASQVGKDGEEIARNLVNISGQALSMAESLRASSIALTAGFELEDMERLTVVARNASISLGRNLPDAIDRLFRGVAKIEPEILDELGILVRLDTAVENYAAQLGKAAADVTDFERRQAFLNAAIEQGELKYGRLGDAVQTNPYDRLAASFGNLAKSFISLANVAIGPLIDMLANNMSVLLGLLIMFGSTVVGKMFPALEGMGTQAIAAAKHAQGHAKAERQRAKAIIDSSKAMVAASKGGGTGMDQLRMQIQQGKQVTNYQKALGSLSKSEKLRARNLHKFQGEERRRKEKELAQIRELQVEVRRLEAAEKGRAASQVRASAAGRAAKESKVTSGGIVAIGGAGGITGFKEAGKAFSKLSKEIDKTERKAGNLTGPKGKAKFLTFGKQAAAGFRLASGGARLFGAALLNAIPLFGQIIFFGSILISTFSGMFKKTDDVKTKTLELADAYESLSARQEKFLEGQANQITVLRNNTANFDQQAEEAFKMSDGLRFASGGLTDLTMAFNDFSEDEIGLKMTRIGFFMRRFAEDTEEAGKFITNLARAIGFLINAEIDKVGKQITAVSEAVETATGMSEENKAKEKLSRVLEGVSDLQAGYNELETAFPRLGILANDSFNSFMGKFPEFFAGTEKITGGLEEFVANVLRIPEVVKDPELALILIQGAMTQFDESTANTLGNVESFGKGMEDLEKKLSVAQSKLARKSEARVFADALKGLIKTSEELRKSDPAAAIQLLTGALSESQLTTLEKFGFTVSTMFKPTDQLAEGESNLETLLAFFDRRAEIDETAAALRKLSQAQIDASKSAIKLAADLDKYNNTLKAIRKTGSPTILPEDAARAAKAAQKVALDNLKVEFKERQALLDLEKEDAQTKLDNDKNISEAARKIRQDDLDDTFKAKQAVMDADKKIAENAINLTAAIARARAGQEGTQLQRIGAVSAAGIFEDGSIDEKLRATRGILTPMIEDLNKLGPEGELIGQLATSAFNVADAFVIMATAVEGSGDKLAAVGAIISSISAVMAANSKAQIANIDGQINAEKKRDGKSKESLAKIEAMEKKKDDMARKAFETNKKMQMASTVVNTAASIVKTLADPNLPVPTNMILASMIGALGAAQLAVISRTKYQSSLSGGEKPSMTNLSIGNRGSNVDVSQRATAGELNYLRGGNTTGQNIGGAGASLPGAAMGRKAYADGGVVVGERGPEVITPTVPVDITPNYALGGQPTNVTFTINAIDAQGVEEVLEAQQGNIIRMIRQAANENGQNFLPEVDTMAYGSKT